MVFPPADDELALLAGAAAAALEEVEELELLLDPHAAINKPVATAAITRRKLDEINVSTHLS